jgi:hypothetical protein
MIMVPHLRSNSASRLSWSLNLDGGFGDDPRRITGTAAQTLIGMSGMNRRSSCKCWSSIVRLTDGCFTEAESIASQLHASETAKGQILPFGRAH